MDRWNGCVALVTEAASRNGAEICRQLVKYPMTVIGIDRNVKKIRKIAREEAVGNAPGHLVGIKCDLLNEEDIVSVFEKIQEDFGQIDICINNASFEHNLPLNDTPEEGWYNIYVNFAYFMICVRESLKLMTEKNSGQIIYISSMAGRTDESSPLSEYYSVVEYLVTVIAVRLQKNLAFFNSNIQAAFISPDLINTGFEIKEVEDPETFHPPVVAESVLYILSTNPRVDDDIPVRHVEQSL